MAAELEGTGVRVNAVEPRAAVMSEGAQALVGATIRPELIESMEQMVEAIVALCRCPPEVTGQQLVSLDLLDAWKLTVHNLDGTPLAAGEAT
jgi:citronellol/citronellal dehydrogenase